MVSQNPPEPRALSDDELNTRVIELQSQPNGLVAAMALIEEQTRLREEDALALSQWQLMAQMEAAVAPPNPEPKQPTRESAASNSEPEPENIPSPTPPTTSPGNDLPFGESVEDIVAALNASYAQAASEPESEVLFEASYEETVTFVSEPLSSEEPKALAALLNPAIGHTAEPDDEIEKPAATKNYGALSFSWLALSTSPLLLLLVAAVFDSGASVAQALIVVPAVILLISVLSAAGAVAAKRANSNLAIVSRAAFGVWGNSLPAILVLVGKIAWLATVVYLATRILNPLLSSQPWFQLIADRLIFPAEFTSAAVVAIFLLLAAALIAGFGGKTVLRSQQLAVVISVLGLVAVAIYVFTSYSISQVQLGESVPILSLADVSILLLAIAGLPVISQSGDFARKLPDGYPSSKVFFVSLINILLPGLAISILGIFWFALDSDLSDLFGSDMLTSVASTAPIWAFVAFAVACGVSIIWLVSSTLYSTIASSYAVSDKLRGAWLVILLTIIALASFVGVSYLLPASSIAEAAVGLLLVIAVPIAAWLGIVFADAALRKRGYHEISLTREYGFYGKFNWVNLIGLVLATALGFGYLNHSNVVSSWAGYLFDLSPTLADYTGSYIGIVMAFLIGLLFPVLFGIPKIRKQEASLLELDQRRLELKQFLDTV